MPPNKGIKETPKCSSPWTLACHGGLYCQNNGVMHAKHCSDIIMSTIASHITGVLIVYSTFVMVQIIHADQRKHQSSASLGFVKGIHRCPVNSPHKGPVTRKLFPSEDVIIILFHLLLVVSVDYSCRCIGIRLSVLVRCNILNNVTHALTALMTKSQNTNEDHSFLMLKRPYQLQILN